MVKVKIIGAEVPDDEQYVGNVYEAIKYTKGDGSLAYYAQVSDNEIEWFNQNYVEVVEDDKPTMAAREPDLRTIKMSDIIENLGITVDDIVCVNVGGIEHYLKCNEQYELVQLDYRHADMAPHLILGMVNCEYSYAVYKYKHGFTVEKRNQQTN